MNQDTFVSATRVRLAHVSNGAHECEVTPEISSSFKSSTFAAQHVRSRTPMTTGHTGTFAGKSGLHSCVLRRWATRRCLGEPLNGHQRMPMVCFTQGEGWTSRSAERRRWSGCGSVVNARRLEAGSTVALGPEKYLHVPVTSWVILGDCKLCQTPTSVNRRNVFSPEKS